MNKHHQSLPRRRRAYKPAIEAKSTRHRASFSRRNRYRSKDPQRTPADARTATLPRRCDQLRMLEAVQPTTDA
jgi:hypothetical protein